MIYLVCGCPGQGKSTWIKEQMELNPGKWISRDKIRFAILDDEDEYFAREKDVLRIFKEMADKAAMIKVDNIYIDATFLTPKSRTWVIEIAKKYNIEITAVLFQRPLETCLTWNRQREGRAFVPESAIRRMYEQFEYPTIEEGFNKIIRIGE